VHALLLLSDGRFPTGAHAHSGGMEAAVAAGAVSGTETLALWLEGRLATTTRVEAAFAAAAWRRAGGSGQSADRRVGPEGWVDLDSELAARTVSPATRRASRAQGRGILRAAQRCWPHPSLDALAAARPEGPGWPLAVGAAATAAGLDAFQAALAAASSGISGPTWAAGRLLGLDPFSLAHLLARLGPAVEAEANAAARWAELETDLAALPADGAPALDLGAETHARWEVRLFAS
jgi:urease accessory protein